jgi:uncharacterized membrane-anchored protein YitT (DUF2179 family)
MTSGDGDEDEWIYLFINNILLFIKYWLRFDKIKYIITIMISDDDCSCFCWSNKY